VVPKGGVGFIDGVKSLPDARGHSPAEFEKRVSESGAALEEGRRKARALYDEALAKAADDRDEGDRRSKDVQAPDPAAAAASNEAVFGFRDGGAELAEA